MRTIGRSASSASRLDIRTCGLLFLCTAGLLLNVCYRPDAAPDVGNLISAHMGAVNAAAAAGHRRDENSRVTGGIIANDGKNSLAYRQSFGFFRDISDDDWRRRQKRARDHRHQASPSVKTVTASLEANRWYMKNYYPLFTCPDQQRVGIGGDGPKWVCDPHRLALPGQSLSGGAEGTTSGARCLVYSIGSNGNYGFEDGLVNLLGPGTCEIHVFDMSRDYTRRNDAENKKIFFHHWGLGSSYTDVGRAEGNTYLTLQETMQKLGHVNRTINIFKIDCEQCEWTSYKDWISDSVDIRQLLIETHRLPTEELGVHPADFFDDIEKAGFAMFSKEPNIHPIVAGRCVEWGFVKLRKEFFGDRVAH